MKKTLKITGIVLFGLLILASLIAGFSGERETETQPNDRAFSAKFQAKQFLETKIKPGILSPDSFKHPEAFKLIAETSDSMIYTVKGYYDSKNVMNAEIRTSYEVKVAFEDSIKTDQFKVYDFKAN